MADWFDSQQVAGYGDWIRNERNLGGTPQYGPGTGVPIPGTEAGAPAPVGGATDPRYTEGTGYNLPAPVQTPFAQTDTGGGQYPLSSVAGSGFMQPWTTAFKAPGYEGLADNPAFKFRMDEGQKAIERAASAKGTLGTMRPLKDMMRWGQGLASEEYDKVYGRSLGEYQMAHDIFKGNQGDQFGRLSSLAGTGQASANTLGSQGTSYAQGGADLMTGAGNAAAAGRVGSANAWNGALGSLADSAMMAAILRSQGGGATSFGSGQDPNNPLIWH